MTTIRTARPITAATARPAPASPLSASRPRATTGRPSLTKLFHTPATTIASVVSDTGWPHERCIDIVTPIDSAPPPGIVLDTAVEAGLATAASRRRNVGCTA